jgi:hypothetical protein
MWQIYVRLPWLQSLKKVSSKKKKLKKGKMNGIAWLWERLNDISDPSDATPCKLHYWLW